MALTLADTCRNAILDAVDTLIGTTGTLEFQTAASAEVATLTLGNPAFGAAGSGTMALSGTPLSDTSATAGTMSKFVLKTGGSTIQITGTVSTSGADINFAGGVTVGGGDTVTLTSFSLSCPAS